MGGYEYLGRPEILYLLHIDLEGSSSYWPNMGNDEERANVKKHCRQYFSNQCEEYDPIKIPDAMGDNFIAWFKKPSHVVNAGRSILSHAKEKLIRTNPVESMLIRPRIIACAAIVSSPDDLTTSSSKEIDQLLPVERNVGEVGRLVIENLLFSFLKSDVRNKFEKSGCVLGKNKDPIQIYKTKAKTKFISWLSKLEENSKKANEISSRDSYVQTMRVILNNNLASRNSITLDLINKIKNNNCSIVEGEWIIRNALDSFRGFLEGMFTKEEKSWNFKLSLWVDNGNEKLKLSHLAYPLKMGSRCSDNDITVAIGSNIVGLAWDKNETILIPNLSSANRSLYEPLHDLRDNSICAMAAFPVMVANDVIGVVCVDTNVSGFYEPKQLDEGFHTMCASSFTLNIALGLLLKEMQS